MASSASRQDEPNPCYSLPRPFCSRNMILPKSELVLESFLSQNILRDSKNIFCQFSVRTEQENEKTESVNENENKVNKIVVAFLQPCSQGLSSLPPFSRWNQRLREAEKRDPGNEVGVSRTCFQYFAIKTGKHKTKNTKRREGLECHIISPRSLFACFWTDTKPRSIKTRKRSQFPPSMLVSGLFTCLVLPCVWWRYHSYKCDNISVLVLLLLLLLLLTVLRYRNTKIL